MSKGNSVLFKILGVVTLGLFFEIPMSYIKELIQERSARKQEAIAEIASGAGGAQRVRGPVLLVPRTVRYSDKQDNASVLRERVENLYLMPRNLVIEATAKADKRSRGIFSVPVYSGDLRLKGSFAFEPLFAEGIGVDDIIQDDIKVLLGVTNISSVHDAQITLSDGPSLRFAAGTRKPNESVLTAPAGFKIEPSSGSAHFEISFSLKGARSLDFIASALKTTVNLTSSWPHPSFEGVHPPASRSVTVLRFK